MIDRLVIRVKGCSNISTKNLQLAEQVCDKFIYHIFYDADSNNPAFLKVTFDKGAEKVKIEGSIRKWYLGMFSLEDLTAEQFKHSIERIAKILDISMEKLMNGTITQCEIGLNVRTRIPADKVNENVRGYKQYKYYRYNFETVGFLGESIKIKLYDKCCELTDNFKRYDTNNEAKRRFEKLKEQGIYTLRIEFTLKDERSFSDAKLEHLHTIGGLIENFYDTIPFFANMCSKLEIGMNVNFNDERINKDEYAILVGAYHQGVLEFSEEYANRSLIKKNNKGIKIGRSASTSKTKARNYVNSIINKYTPPKSYHANQFRIDIYKTLKFNYGDSPQTSMREMIRTLLGLQSRINIT